MAKEVLSESEIDKLLGLLAEDAPSNEAGTKEQMSQDEKDKALGVPEKKSYRHYDFKRPHKFSNYASQEIKRQFEENAIMMEQYLFWVTGIKWSFSSVAYDELTYEEFFRCVKMPAFFGPVIVSNRLNSFVCSSYTVVSKNLLYPIFVNAKDDFEKEPGKKCPKIYERPKIYGDFLHDVIAEIVHNFFSEKKFFDNYNFGFYFFSEKDFEREKLKANKDEMGLLVTMTVNVKNEEGTIDFYIPHDFFLETLEPSGDFTQPRTPFARKRLPGNGYVPLGWCEINDENRHLLKAGEEITFAQLIDEPLPLVLRENHLMFAEGDVTMVDEDYAVRITKIHADPKDPNLVKHYGDYGLNVLPGNVYACLGEFQIHDEKEVNVDDVVELNKATYDLVDLIEKDSGKVIARGEVFNNHYLFAVKITEVL